MEKMENECRGLGEERERADGSIGGVRGGIGSLFSWVIAILMVGIITVYLIIDLIRLQHRIFKFQLLLLSQ